MKKILKEFREFAVQGNMIDMAVGMIIGAAFKDLVNSLVSDMVKYVFKRLGQTYNVEFILKDAELGKYSYKATFEGESLNEI